MSASDRGDTEVSDSSASSKKRVVQIDPLAITESLGFRIFRKGGRKPWTKEEDTKLVELVQTGYTQPIDLDQVDWDSIAEQVASDGLRKGKWTKEEDEELIRAYKKHGASWLKVSLEIEGRTDDQCAKRYMEVLDPSTKNRLEPWSMEEDLRLIQLIKKYGTKWRTICNSFDSRPALTCRNRWRKLVTDVVRGKADPLIKKEVEKVTNGAESDASSDGNILEVLSKQQEELTKQKKTADVKKPRPPKRIHTGPEAPSSSSSPSSRMATMPPPSSSSPSESTSRSRSKSVVSGPAKTDVEWRYTLGHRGSEDNDLPLSLLFDSNAGGVIKDEQTVKFLVSYAKKNNMNVTVHQHIHHHYAAAGSPKEGNHRGSVSGPAAYNVEPEDQQARFQHFNYLPPLVQVPKLNSSHSSPNNSSQGDNSHMPTSSTQPKTDPPPNDFDGSRESDIMKLLNGAEEFNKQREGTPGSNPLTPLAQAVEFVESEDNQKYKRRKVDSGKTTATGSSHSHGHHRHNQQFDLPSEDEEGLDFWETMRNLNALPYANPKTPNKVNPIPEQTTSAHSKGPVVSSTTTTNNYSQKPVSQHHPLHYYNSKDDEEDEVDEEGLDEEDKVLAREVAEVGVDQETLNSYGLFYNVYTREGSTFPDTQPQNKPEEQSTSVYDQWGGGFGIIPFNPS
ncbi:Myb-like DNA-binding protein BAS1 [Candida viswanathii]|uniref:Myb-like DNA-binding protein BAS1 n=1 Tax=Candida viswanathii TaxID=5486 RepID=A0A367XUX9_9ASCO|nr:Myb-like DNA-binding protein BAS1 [Candida viswanathii]